MMLRRSLMACVAALTLSSGCGSDGGGESLGLETSGVDGSDDRRDEVFDAWCDKSIECQDTRGSKENCVSNRVWYFDMEAEKPAACRDAVLDFYACRAKVTCADYWESCDAEHKAQQDKCK